MGICLSVSIVALPSSMVYCGGSGLKVGCYVATLSGYPWLSDLSLYTHPSNTRFEIRNHRTHRVVKDISLSIVMSEA
ncbi:uncharacterized protein F5147DRAFT_664229 [Suillus discolor]|uniref:Secreted protein n=1 Tax=Suillus discolor TaxID=1912936 RepID=A0A9P7FPA8_9AGAM|nr:uncharacterized protein F5147DRAFT_664229 [Suillus discolor]KAG2121081.1 hypothetical protein F5147DRAFT_664229 [Suillus discolor]